MGGLLQNIAPAPPGSARLLLACCRLPRTRCWSPLQQHSAATRSWWKCVANSCTCAIITTHKHSHRKHGQSVRAKMDSARGNSIQSFEKSSSWMIFNNGAFYTQGNFLERVDAFYRFTRPHTIIGTVLAVISVSLLALQSYQDVSLHLAIEVVRVLVPTLLMNLYIVAVNQLIDVEIDKVNKPFLPLASGDFSLNTGISLTILSAALSFALGSIVSSKILTWSLVMGFVMGTGYSLEFPFLRWKKWGLAAALIIPIYRTFVLQIGTFLHIQTFVFGRVATLNKSIIFLSAFVFVLAMVVAVLKDIPDLEGDKAHGIQSFVVQLGPDRVFWCCMYVLTGAYGVAMLASMTSKFMWAQVGTIVGHAIAIIVLWKSAIKVDLKDKASVTQFYMFIWKLLYAEFFLAQFVR